jgi:alkane 1-monooxygenase
MTQITLNRSSTSETRPGDPPRFAVLRFVWAFAMFALPLIATLAAANGATWLPYLPLIVVYAAIPVIDYAFNPKQPVEFDRQQAKDQPLARRAFDLPLLCLPAWFITLFTTLWLAQSFNGIIWVVCVVGLGVAGGIVAINPAHELIHRRSRWHRFAGGVLLSAVIYGPFKVEHLRGHHRWVGTKKDRASALRGQTIYSFAPQSLIGNFIGGYRHEQRRLQKNNLAWFHSEVWHWMGLSALIAISLYLLASWQAVAGFVLASLVAIFKLELINYIEHYGLHRKANSQGVIEPITAAHSWTCDTWFVNAILFNVQRHADHHANPGREYLALRDLSGAPRLPLGYASMVLLALVPPFWFAVMHPRLDQFECDIGKQH